MGNEFNNFQLNLKNQWDLVTSTNHFNKCINIPTNDISVHVSQVHEVEILRTIQLTTTSLCYSTNS